jgi:hypothetical protein
MDTRRRSCQVRHPGRRDPGYKARQVLFDLPILAQRTQRKLENAEKEFRGCNFFHIDAETLHLW